MAGRKKVAEETITTEERLGREMQEMDGAEMLSAGDAAAEGDGMDLNELLESMDQEPEETGGQEDEELPELSEEEMFGEAAAETDGDGTEDAGAAPETALGIPAEDRQPEKPKRTSRRKKADGQSTEETAAEDSTKETSAVEQTAAEDDPTEQISVEGADEQAAEGEEPMEGGHSMEEEHSMEQISIQETEEQSAEGNLDEAALIEGENLSNGDLQEETPEDMQETETDDDAQELQESETADETPGGSRAETGGNSTGQTNSAASRRTPRAGKTEAPVLTLESRGEVETESAREDTIWHEIHNAYRTRRILTGQLGGIEQTDSGKTIVIVDYKGFRIVIPLKEMMIDLAQGRSPSGKEYAELMLRQNKILGNMLGAEIDFIVKGIDSKTRSVVASRREAMLKKRQIFYLDTDAAGMYRVYEGRIVQARVIAVAEKVIRVEIFGVECSIMARDLAWDWIGDAHERFSVGDQVLVRILSVRREDLEDMGVKADVKSVTQDTHHENLKKCRIQSKYAGRVTDVYKGVVYIRLSNGVNAVAHACYDYRTPGKKDDVSFAVTKIDEERGVAVGIITRIIRQNL